MYKNIRSLKDYGKRSKEMSTRIRHLGSEEKDASQKLKINLIRLCEDHQTQKTSPNLGDPNRLGRPPDFKRS
jgi:hypothetical protein